MKQDLNGLAMFSKNAIQVNKWQATGTYESLVSWKKKFFLSTYFIGNRVSFYFVEVKHDHLFLMTEAAELILPRSLRGLLQLLGFVDGIFMMYWIFWFIKLFMNKQNTTQFLKMLQNNLTRFTQYWTWSRDATIL